MVSHSPPHLVQLGRSREANTAVQIILKQDKTKKLAVLHEFLSEYFVLFDSIHNSKLTMVDQVRIPVKCSLGGT